MILDRTKNALRSIIWGVIEKITLLLLPFITRTVLIKVLGVDYLGLNTLFVSILQVLSVSELGIGTAIVFSMYKPIAEDDNKTLCALLNLYKKIYHIVGWVILVAGLAIMPFLPHLIKGDVPPDVSIYVLYLIFLFNTVISYFLFAYKTALFSAYQRNDVASKRNAAISVFSNLAQITLLFTVHNYYAYVLIIPVGTILTNLVNAYYAKKMYPDIVCEGTVSKEKMTDIKKRMIGLVFNKIHSVTYGTIATIVISSFLGLRPLALYNNYSAIINIFIGFLTIITNSLTAGVGNKIALESREKIYIDFKNYMFILGWLCSFFVVMLVAVIQNFMIIWLGNDFLLSNLTIMLLLINFMLEKVVNNTVILYRQAAGLWYEDRYRFVVMAIVNLICSFILVKHIGINGVILSTTIITLFIAIPWGSWIIHKYYFRKSMKEYWQLSLFYYSVTMFVAFICYFICNVWITSNTFWALIIKIIITFWISNLLFLLFYHKTQEFVYAKTKFIKIVKQSSFYKKITKNKIN